jgi:hypothetical protein
MTKTLATATNAEPSANSADIRSPIGDGVPIKMELNPELRFEMPQYPDCGADLFTIRILPWFMKP